jgi:hypothetical protein
VKSPCSHCCSQGSRPRHHMAGPFCYAPMPGAPLEYAWTACFYGWGHRKFGQQKEVPSTGWAIMYVWPLLWCWNAFSPLRAHWGAQCFPSQWPFILIWGILAETLHCLYLWESRSKFPLASGKNEELLEVFSLSGTRQHLLLPSFHNRSEWFIPIRPDPGCTGQWTHK